jgi:hypothetical protein
MPLPKPGRHQTDEPSDANNATTLALPATHADAPDPDHFSNAKTGVLPARAAARNVARAVFVAATTAMPTRTSACRTTCPELLSEGVTRDRGQHPGRGKGEYQHSLRVPHPEGKQRAR